MKEKSRSSRLAKLRSAKEKPTSEPLQAPHRKNDAPNDSELAALIRLRDEDIGTSDIPEITDWSKALVGKFYRPIKNSITIRLDPDVLAWLKRSGRDYQTRIHALLRQAMHRTRRRR